MKLEDMLIFDVLFFFSVSVSLVGGFMGQTNRETTAWFLGLLIGVKVMLRTIGKSLPMLSPTSSNDDSFPKIIFEGSKQPSTFSHIVFTFSISLPILSIAWNILNMFVPFIGVIGIFIETGAINIDIVNQFLAVWVFQLAMTVILVYWGMHAMIFFLNKLTLYVVCGVSDRESPESRDRRVAKIGQTVVAIGAVLGLMSHFGGKFFSIS